MASQYPIRWRIAMGFACLLAYFQASKGNAQDQSYVGDERLKKAEVLIEAGLQERAILIYQEILQDLQSASHEGAPNLQTAMNTRFLLAHALNERERYEEALRLLEENLNTSIPLSTELEEVHKNSLYLSAMVYKGIQHYGEAKNAFLKYLSFESHLSPLRNQAKFEIALISFLNGSMDEAKSQFEIIKDEQLPPRLYALVQLYLARIALAIGNPSSAMASLASLAQHLPQDDELQFELRYLQGEAGFLMKDFQKAVQFFESSLPKSRSEKCSWYSETLYRLGWSYLHLGESQTKDQHLPDAYFFKAEALFQKLLEILPDERTYLALGQCYLSRAAALKDENAYAQAESLLSKHEIFSSREAQDHALLLRAEAASSYENRDKFYRQLTQPAHSSSPFFAKSWYLRALNDFEEGKALIQSGSLEKGIVILESSGTGFRKAFEMLKEIDKTRAASALKYLALAVGNRDSKDASMAAFSVLDELINQRPSLLYSLDHPDEIFYLHGFYAARLAESEGPENYTELDAKLGNSSSDSQGFGVLEMSNFASRSAYFAIARQSLKHAAVFPNSKFGSEALNHLGALQYRCGQYSEAEASFLQVASDFPSSEHVPEALFWAGCCAEKQPQGKDTSQQRKRFVFENYPDSPFAAEAFFTLYTYHDYLQGERNAIKHLQNFIRKFPHSPLLIQGYFLIGLDYKRDRKSPEGKWIRKKSMTEAIDAFQNGETHFDRMVDKGLIPSSQVDYYSAVYYRAILERAMANLAIAEESSGAKRQIYLEYAEEVFKRLIDDLVTLTSPHAKQLFKGEVFPPIYEESAFWLAQAYIKEENDSAAENIFSEMLDRYRQARITRGYFLSRLWYEQGGIDIRRGDFSKALSCFKQAEDSSKGNVLGTDQRLDLWIQESICHRELGHLDDAILILSKAINDDAISALRLKAMYLRAEIYELQKRLELARKQLDSLAKKGGMWAQKAKEKLEKEYGY